MKGQVWGILLDFLWYPAWVACLYVDWSHLPVKLGKLWVSSGSLVLHKPHKHLFASFLGMDEGSGWGIILDFLWYPAWVACLYVNWSHLPVKLGKLWVSSGSLVLHSWV